MSNNLLGGDDMELDTETPSTSSGSGPASSNDFTHPNIKRKSSYELAMEVEKKKYLADLQAEIAGWATLTAERKKALRVAKKESEKQMVLTYKDIKDHLTPEERAFIEARPDYKGLRKRAEAAKVAMDIAVEERRETMVRVYHFVDKLEKQQKEDIKKIIDMKDPILDS